MNSAIRFVVSLGILAAIGANVRAQEPTPVSPAAPPASAAEPAPKRTVMRTVEAMISALDAKANTLSLQIPSLDKPATTETMLAVPDSKCRFLKNNRAALLSDFAVGDKVVVRLTYRTLPVATVVVREMADAASYAEKQKQGKEITEGKIQSVSAKELAVRRADGVDVTFRISAKTVVTKADAVVSLAAYPIGSSVVVKPRRLPNGGLMATVIGESEEAVNQTYRDSLTNWSGLVEAVTGSETTGATIRMKRDDGAIRSFRIPANVVFKGGRGDVPWAKMIGMNVSAHLLPRATGSTDLRLADAIKVAGTSREDAVIAP